MRKSSVFLFAMVMGMLFVSGAYLPAYAQGGADEFMLEEVTVTAEKREVNVQKTAMSVTAITGNELDGKAITDLKGALEGMAGVNILAIPGGGQVFIRGVGSTIDANLGDPSVSVQLDNIYVGRVEAALAAMYDVERVEVLRGPQGTMYGRNAAGGQINVISKRPTDEFEADANLSIGDFNLKKISAAVNTPMGEQWAARFAVNREERDGYISDGADSADKFGARARLAFDPSQDLSFLLTYEYSHDQSSPANTLPVPGSAGNLPPYMPWVDDTLPETGWPVEADDAWVQDEYHPAPWSDNEFIFYSLEMNWDMGWSQLYMLPAINQNKRALGSELLFGTSLGGSNQIQPYEEDQWSYEVRLQNPEDSAIQWLVGFYYLDSDNKDVGDQAEVDPLESSMNSWNEETGYSWGSANYRRPTDVYAYYGQATAPITDRFRVTAGVRQTVDTRNMGYRYAHYDITDPSDPFYALATVTGDGRREYDSGILEYSNEQDDITYRGGLEFDLADASMLYAFVTTGYKAGGLNLQGVVPPSEYEPEELVAYTFGSKNRFMGNRLQVNVEAYYYDYDNYQSQVMTMVYDARSDGMTQANMVINADKGHNAGLEVEADFMISAKDRINATLAYMDTEYGTLVLPGPNPPAGYFDDFDLTGRDMANAPEFSGTLGYEHMFTLDNGGSIVARLQTKISDGYWVTHEQYLGGAWQDGYHMSDMFVTYTAPTGKYSVGLWAKNLENEDVATRVMPAYRRTLMPPRTMGVNCSVSF